MKVRNIEVVWRHDNGNTFFATQLFTDWWDFADFLKQEELANRLVILKSWRYVVYR